MPIQEKNDFPADRGKWAFRDSKRTLRDKNDFPANRGRWTFRDSKEPSAIKIIIWRTEVDGLSATFRDGKRAFREKTEFPR